MTDQWLTSELFMSYDASGGKNGGALGSRKAPTIRNLVFEAYLISFFLLVFTR